MSRRHNTGKHILTIGWRLLDSQAASAVPRNQGRSRARLSFCRIDPLSWRVRLLSTGVALAFGILHCALLTTSGKTPAGLRDYPGPMELMAGAATLCSLGLLGAAYQQRRRIRATVYALLAPLNTALFVMGSTFPTPGCRRAPAVRADPMGQAAEA